MAPPTDPTTVKLLAELKVLRGSVQGRQTKMKTYVEKFGSDTTLADLETRLGLLEGYLSTFNSVQSKIEYIDEDEAKGEKRELFEETYCGIKSKILTFISQKKPRGSLMADSQLSFATYRTKTARLPQLELTKFTGKTTDWPNFFSMFKTLVHDDDELSNIEKFQHLRSTLSESAFRTIQSLEMTAENYEKAIELLKKRYDNKRLIFQAHIHDIYNLSTAEKGSIYHLRNLNDSVNSHLRALSSLVEIQQITDGLLIYLISQKLDPASRNKWEDEAPRDVVPSWDEFSSFIEKRCQTLENMAQTTIATGNKPASTNFVNQHKRNTNQVRKTTLITTKTLNICSLCNNSEHIINNCPNFITLIPINRFNEVKRLNLCINCLRSGHSVKNCRSSRCRFCSAKHHSLLHMAPVEQNANLASLQAQPERIFVPQPSQGQGRAQPSVALCSNSGHSTADNFHVFLATAIIQIKDSVGSYTSCRALLDSASQLNFISERLCQQLRIKRIKVNVPVSGIGKSNTSVKFKVNIQIKSRLNEYTNSFEAYVLPSITENQPSSYIDTKDLDIPDDINLADPGYNKAQRIDLLIGASNFFELLSVGQLKLGVDEPLLPKTVFGWIVSGNFKTKVNSKTCNIAITPHSDVSHTLDNLLKRFWEIENYTSIVEGTTSEEMECEAHFSKTYLRLPSGRFSVRLPFRCSPSILGDSLETAKRRYFNLESKLSKSFEIKQQYCKFMEDYLRLGHMQPIKINELSVDHYFLPHHCVLKPESTSTKLRVVFDGSCKTSTGQSLNDILMVGPVVQDDLFTILLRFRKFRYAMTADISKMYRQVEVQDPDNHMQCILWRNSKDTDLQIYRLMTVTYGTSSASFLATRCLKKLGEEEEPSFDLGSRIVKNDFYVDDMLTGTDSIEEAIRARYEVEGLLQRGGFLLHKWCSNDDQILNHIPVENREKLANIGENDAVKTLGLTWNPTQDKFHFTFADSDNSVTATKRKILSTIARLYDPLGLINPIIVKAKIFMQSLWKLNVDWDESLPIELQSQWKSFIHQLKDINQIGIERHVLPQIEYVNLELHGYADASSLAYGACLYIRATDKSDNITIKLLCAKSKVAPIKTQSIPRLELCAALMLSELMNRVISCISIDFHKSYYWSDSTIVLSWISAQACNLNTFVGNRVSKIQELTQSCNWKHVPTSDNPADIISRGLSPGELMSSQLWFNGPSFLTASESSWPPQHIFQHQDLPEQRKLKVALITERVEDLVTTSKFRNTLLKLQAVFAYIFRFYHNAKLKNPSKRTFGPLGIDELDFALKAVIKMVQKREFSPDYDDLSSKKEISTKSCLNTLTPFLDKEGLIRVGGRIRKSGLDYDCMHQIILPRSHPLTDALITHYHQKNLHAGHQTLLYILRTRFWPLGGRSTVKKVLHRCIRCFRTRPKSIQQLMGDLPTERVQPSRPFSTSGVDFCGPFYITQLVRGRSPTKAYACLFICFSTKAVHIEPVSDLTTEGFLSALKRFIARRGWISKIYSDNATNFLGANNKLKELRALFSSQQHVKDVHDVCIKESIEWKFIPPRSPHFGGLWEASVKIAKSYIRRVVGYRSLTYEELATLLCQVEAIINSRPITPISSDPNDLEALTLGHFLVGSPLVSIPEPNILDKHINYISRWQKVQLMQQLFWARWSKEYLQHLQQRSKWNTREANIAVNTLVILKDQNMPPLNWPLGRILEVHTGADGLVRVVTVRTPTGIFKRAVAKICPLPMKDDDS